MIKPGPDDRVYPVVKLAAVVEALAQDGIPAETVLAGARISKLALASPATRVSLNQVLEGYRNASKLSRDSHFAFRAGLRFHMSAYGMYGFALLSSMNYRHAMQFAEKYHQLATPLAEIRFTEQSGRAIWTIAPIPHSRVDAALYKFLVEMQLGIFLSLFRDIMGPSFAAQEFHVTYRAPDGAAKYPDIFGCPILFGRSENRFVFDATWLDGTPKLGNDITYAAMVDLCDRLMDELQLSAGVAGRVRRVLLTNLMRTRSFGEVASDVNMSERTLRRKLREENTSFRNLVDQLRMEMAIKYLRETKLTVETIAGSLGFSDAANFRHSFRRWTKAAPHMFRDISDRAAVSS